MSSRVPKIQKNFNEIQKHQNVTSTSTGQRQTPRVDQQDDYRQYVQMKKIQSIQQNNSSQNNESYNKKICIVVFVIAMIIVFVTAIIYTSRYKAIEAVDQINTKEKQSLLKPPNHFYTRHHHGAAPAGPAAPSGPSNKCNLLLPYNMLNEEETKQNYHKWFGKVGDYVNGRKYETGHFIERHVAVEGQCTDQQVAEGKTVFFDWNQVIKGFRQANQRQCPVGDKTSFSYNFQLRIANPSQYIKGIDCRSGSMRRFSNIFILYRKATQNSYPQQQEYLNSNTVTIWTFYPKY